MGKLSPTSTDLANPVISGAFVGVTDSASEPVFGAFNVSLWGTFSATVQVQRSFDGGTTWLPASYDGAGDPAQYTAPVSLVVNEPERGVLYRLACTAFTSGTVNYRLSGSGNGASWGGA